MCTVDREPVFGAIVHGHVRLNAIGHVVADTWRWLTVQYPYVTLDEWCVMPDHLHGILLLGGSRTAPTGDTVTTNVDAPLLVRSGVGGSGTEMGGSRTAPTGDTAITRVDLRRKPVGGLIGAFKTVSTKRINGLRKTPRALVWQRDFWDHVVRDETDLHRIRAYIRDNVRL